MAPLPSERKHWWLTNRKVGSLCLSLPLSLSLIFILGFVYSFLIWVKTLNTGILVQWFCLYNTVCIDKPHPEIPFVLRINRKKVSTFASPTLFFCLFE